MPKAACPICGEPQTTEFRPFCSRRCADIDLGRWLTGAYAVAAEEEDTPEAEALHTERPNGGDVDTSDFADALDTLHTRPGDEPLH